MQGGDDFGAGLFEAARLGGLAGADFGEVPAELGADERGAVEGLGEERPGEIGGEAVLGEPAEIAAGALGAGIAAELGGKR